MTRRKLSPKNMKKHSTPKAIATSRIATHRRRAGGTVRMTGMKTGRLPNGSSTSSSRMKAETKLWSTVAAVQ